MKSLENIAKFITEGLILPKNSKRAFNKMLGRFAYAFRTLEIYNLYLKKFDGFKTGYKHFSDDMIKDICKDLERTNNKIFYNIYIKLIQTKNFNSQQKYYLAVSLVLISLLSEALEKKIQRLQKSTDFNRAVSGSSTVEASHVLVPFNIIYLFFAISIPAITCKDSKCETIAFVTVLSTLVLINLLCCLCMSFGDIRDSISENNLTYIKKIKEKINQQLDIDYQKISDVRITIPAESLARNAIPSINSPTSPAFYRPVIWNESLPHVPHVHVHHLNTGLQ